MIVNQDANSNELTLYFKKVNEETPLLTVFDATYGPLVGDYIALHGKRYIVIECTIIYTDERTDSINTIEER